MTVQYCKVPEFNRTRGMLTELTGALKLPNQLAAVFACHEGSKEDPSQGNRDNFLLAERLKTAFDRGGYELPCVVLCIA
jgi:hypothetical protein